MFWKCGAKAISLAARLCCICVFGAAVFAQASPPVGAADEPLPAPSISPTPTPFPLPSPSPAPSPSGTLSGRPATTERTFVRNVIRDQSLIWTAPFRFRGTDLKIFGAFAGGTVALIATDRFTSSWVERGGTLAPVSRGFSEPGTAYAAGGVSAGLYAIGKLTHNQRLTETGLLAGEAYLDSGIVVGVVKLATQRPRPNLYSGMGPFFKGGTSFPSGHSSSAWSVATVIAHEYQDRPAIRIGAYLAATAVALARYSGRAHFMSEVLMGSAIGFYTGRFVYRTRHVPIVGAGGGDNVPGETTKLMPTLMPFFDGRTATYGAKANWTF